MLWWTDDLKTGVEIVDNQHKAIFEKASEIFELDIESDIEKIKKIFEFLMGYTTNHFYEEELMMMENNYPDFIQHRNEHNYFVEEIYKLYLEMVNNKISQDALDELKALVIEWLAEHISKSDRRFIIFLQEERLKN